MNKISSFTKTRGLRGPLDGSASVSGCDASSKGRTIPLGGLQDSAIDERTLVRSARQGDLQAFNRLVLAYQDRAFTQACYLLGDPMAAEDIVQEAFITSFKALSDFRGGSFRSWLMRIVTNRCLDELRRWKSHPTTGFEAINVEGEEIESPYWSADPGETPEESLIQAETGDSLLRCLGRLRAEYRTAIVLVDIFDMRYEEAAEIIGCPIGTIKSRLARARLQMQHFLREDPNIICW